MLSLASPTQLLLDRALSLDGEPAADRLEAAAIVIATGTRLSPPGTVPADDKKGGVDYFRGLQGQVEKAGRIAIIGGGAVGVRKYYSILETGACVAPAADLTHPL